MGGQLKIPPGGVFSFFFGGGGVRATWKPLWLHPCWGDSFALCSSGRWCYERGMVDISNYPGNG